MAIELLLRQRRRGIAVAAAAPLLLILTVATFSCSPVAATASSPELVELTLLAGAREKGAVIRYCDGASFAGDAEGEDLAMLTGCSAGSLAALLHCDNFRERFPKDVSVKCLSDAGFFIDEKDLSGERSLRSLINGIVHLQNVREALPKGCLANKDPTEIRNALAPNGSYPGQAWSSCKADIRNCSSTQIDVLHGFRKKLVSELKVAEHNRDWGLFIDSCFTHCQTPFRISWISRISPRLGNKTIAEAVGDWYFGRREEVKYIDCEYPCNPTCSSRLPSA
uniref:Pectin acetylesterase n=1 Tax=Setaria italica TaxID=4555 RepID=K3XKS9_SETIT